MANLTEVGDWSSDLGVGWLGIGNWGVGVSWLSVGKTSWSNNSGAGNSHEGQESGDLSANFRS